MTESFLTVDAVRHSRAGTRQVFVPSVSLIQGTRFYGVLADGSVKRQNTIVLNRSADVGLNYLGTAEDTRRAGLIQAIESVINMLHYTSRRELARSVVVYD